MFGYVVVNRPELKIRDYEMYRSYYCGLCHALKKRYGRTAQMLLNYDMAFLALLLSGLYEPPEKTGKGRCIPHPVAKHREVSSEAIDYAADMTVLLAYEKALDDWRDEKKKRSRALSALLKKDAEKIREKWPRQAEALQSAVRKLTEAEKEGSRDIDKVAGFTGEFLGEMFVWKEDVWRKQLREMGFFLGKYIYLLDALDDLSEDRKRGNYNLLLYMDGFSDAADQAGTDRPRQALPPAEAPGGIKSNTDDGEWPDQTPGEKEVYLILTDLMARCTAAFERLPIVGRHADILRNILYSGVWVRYAQVIRRRSKARSGKKEGSS